jgi:hypothetical protein
MMNFFICIIACSATINKHNINEFYFKYSGECQEFTTLLQQRSHLYGVSAVFMRIQPLTVDADFSALINGFVWVTIDLCRDLLFLKARVDRSAGAGVRVSASAFSRRHVEVNRCVFFRMSQKRAERPIFFLNF